MTKATYTTEGSRRLLATHWVFGPAFVEAKNPGSGRGPTLRRRDRPSSRHSSRFTPPQFWTRSDTTVLQNHVAWSGRADVGTLVKRLTSGYCNYATDSRQEQAIPSRPAIRLTVGGEECVLLRKDVYDRGDRLDFSPWTTEEMDALASSRGGCPISRRWLRRGRGMNIEHGDVLKTRFPHGSGGRGKKRPVVVVRPTSTTRSLRHAVLTQVSTNLDDKDDPAYLFIEVAKPGTRYRPRSRLPDLLYASDFDDGGPLDQEESENCPRNS